MIAIGLGSNIGDRQQYIATAIERLHQHPDITVEQISSVYETKPVGVTEQPEFLNVAIAVLTRLTPQKLLAACLEVERQMGRVRQERWGPRNIDIDVLIYHDEQIADEALTLPHPRLPERCFVLIPLAEIAGDLPVYAGKTAGELLQNRPDIQDVRRYGTIVLPAEMKSGGNRFGSM